MRAFLHERFRTFCVSLAQMLYRSEAKPRTNILGEPAKYIRPLSETRAVGNSATPSRPLQRRGDAHPWKAYRSQAKRREGVDQQLEVCALLPPSCPNLFKSFHFSAWQTLTSRLRGVEERLGGRPEGREVGGERAMGVEERSFSAPAILSSRSIRSGSNGTMIQNPSSSRAGSCKNSQTLPMTISSKFAPTVACSSTGAPVRTGSKRIQPACALLRTTHTLTGFQAAAARVYCSAV
ncbi:hypothetical protein C8R46DRAFT_1341550 [Mycena filopes]|nr:hypothetical protein C8R46DRAFT_1341550 [Mycena filopes]